VTPRPARHRIVAALGALALLASASVFAAQFEFSGALAAELRWFPDNPKFPGQFEHWQPSLVFEPEFRWRLENSDRVTVIPFLRADARDDERTHFDLREAFWSRRGDQWDVLLGVNRVFWGVTESRHLVNIINQIDGVEDLVDEDFLGQPMIHFYTPRDWGSLDLFILPGFRERTFAGPDGRPRFFLPVDTDNPLYESGAENHHVDFSARYSNVFGDWDVGTSVFWGTGREPSFVISPTGASLLPVYSIITQAGADVQYTRDAWLWKFEGIVREGQGDTFGALVAGFEYTFYQVTDGAADLGVLVEYQYDGRDDNFATTPPTIADNDVFFGARLALNDVQGTAILAGATVDLDNQSTVFIIEFERRLNNSLSLEATGRFFINAQDDVILQNFENDSFIDVNVIWSF